jgi:cation transport ATPase
MRAPISLIIVAGACGIAAGTPLAILGAIGRVARLGAIVKGGVHLETLGRVDAVVFDKTGTLTVGKPDVQQIVPAAGASSDEILAAAAAARIEIGTPVWQRDRCVRAHAKCDIAEPISFAYTPGRGILARVDDCVILVGSRLWLTHRSGDNKQRCLTRRSGGCSRSAETLRRSCRVA